VRTIRTLHGMMILERSAVTRALVIEEDKTMTDEQWTVKDLVEALKQFPADAKVFYEMGPNGPGTVGKAQYVKAWGENDEMGVLLDR
jgi:hypothetical protein